MQRSQVTDQDYQHLLAKQRYKCAVCGWKHQDHKRGRLVVDHDHKTGEVRGLLCWKCNWEIISYHRTSRPLWEAARIWTRAAEYLDRHYTAKKEATIPAGLQALIDGKLRGGESKPLV